MWLCSVDLALREGAGAPAHVLTCLRPPISGQIPLSLTLPLHTGSRGQLSDRDPHSFSLQDLPHSILPRLLVPAFSTEQKVPIPCSHRNPQLSRHHNSLRGQARPPSPARP